MRKPVSDVTFVLTLVAGIQSRAQARIGPLLREHNANSPDNWLTIAGIGHWGCCVTVNVPTRSRLAPICASSCR